MTRPFAARFSDLVARLVPRLSFDEPLEAEFRRWHAEHTRSRVRNAMWLAMGNMLVVMLAGGPFREMRDAIFGPENQLIVDVLRFGFIVPSCIAMLLVSYTNLYRSWFSLTAQIVAPVHALSFVVMDILMQPRGYSLSSWLPLVVLAPYFLFGMLHAQVKWSEDHKPAWVLKAEEEQRQRDAELKSLVGDAKFKAWEEYKRTVPARMLIRQWRSTLDGSLDSLREDQIPLLITAIAEAQEQVNADLASGAMNSSEHSEGYRRALHEAAAPYVTSTQLARLDKLVAKQVTGQDVLSEGQKPNNP